MNEKELSQASFDVFKAMEIIRNTTGNWRRMLRDVKQFAADYENQDSDMKYARMLGLYEGFVGGFDHDLEDLDDIIEEGYSAAMILSGELK